MSQKHPSQRQGKLAPLFTAALLMLVYPYGEAKADTNWTGTINNDWFNTGNWDAGVPNNGIIANLNTLNNRPTITTSGAVSNTLYIGNTSTSELTVTNGGTITSHESYIGFNAGSSGTVNLTGSGSTWDFSGNAMFIGEHGNGVLNISNGATVNNGLTALGYHNDGTGTATVTGTNSQLICEGSFHTGSDGTGTLTISDGGTVSNMKGFIGTTAGSHGITYVTGMNSSWINNSYFFVGYNGQGSLIVSDGGTVSSARHSYIGANASSTSDATVTGRGSNWSSDRGFYLGSDGTGTLTISNGGSVTSAEDSIIGRKSTGVGTGTVTGAGSSWTSNGNFYIGNYGTGRLTLSDSGKITAPTIKIAAEVDSIGTFNIGAAEGDTAVKAGIVNASTVTLGAGAAKIVFNHTEGCGDGSACGGVTGSNTAYEFTPDITGSGSIFAKFGHTIASGDWSAFTGTTTVDDAASFLFSGAYGGSLEVGSGGVVSANNTISGTVAVNDGGTLKGSGSVGTTTVASGGIVAPGNSIGTINVTGDINFAAGSFLDVEVDGDGNNDKIIATGTATITGGTVRIMPELATDNVMIGSTYTILTGNTAVAGTFDAVMLQKSSLFLTPTLSYDANNVYATINRNATSFVSSAQTYNQRQVAMGLETAALSNKAMAAVALSSTHAESQAAFDNLSGELHANIKGDLLGRESNFSELMLEQQGVAYERTQTWSTYYGDWSQRNSDRFNDVTMSTNGIAFGRNGAVSDNTAIGIAASYGRTIYTQDAAIENTAKAHIDHYRVGATAAHKQDNLTLKGSLHYGYHCIGTDRHVMIPYYTAKQTADSHAHSLSSSIEAAYRFQPSAEATIEPYVQTAYGFGHLDGFEEKGGDGSLRVRQDALTEGRTKLGVRLKQKLAFGDTPANLNINLGWQHKLGSLTPEGRYSIGEGETFRSQGAAHSRDALTFKAGLDIYLTEALMMDMSYETDQSETTASHNVNLGVKLAF